MGEIPKMRSPQAIIVIVAVSILSTYHAAASPTPGVATAAPSAKDVIERALTLEEANGDVVRVVGQYEGRLTGARNAFPARKGSTRARYASREPCGDEEELARKNEELTRENKALRRENEAAAELTRANEEKAQLDLLKCEQEHDNREHVLREQNNQLREQLASMSQDVGRAGSVVPDDAKKILEHLKMLAHSAKDTMSVRNYRDADKVQTAKETLVLIEAGLHHLLGGVTYKNFH